MSTYLKRTQALIAALLLALGLALGLAGMQHAYADEGGDTPSTPTETKAIEGTAYLSIANDGVVATSEGADSGKLVSNLPVDLAEVSKIKLADYGLDAFNQDIDGDGYFDITMLHLFIYAHAQFCADGTDGFHAYQSSYEYDGVTYTSLYIDKFWGVGGGNVVYWLDGQQTSDTADKYALSDGSNVELYSFAYPYYTDSNNKYFHFVDGSSVQHVATAYAGIAHEFGLKEAGYDSDWNFTEGPAANRTVSYGKAYGTAEGTATTDANGKFSLTFDEAGTYYVWTDGLIGTAEGCEGKIVSGTACLKLTVQAEKAIDLATLDKGLYTVTGFQVDDRDDFGGMINVDPTDGPAYIYVNAPGSAKLLVRDYNANKYDYIWKGKVADRPAADQTDQMIAGLPILADAAYVANGMHKNNVLNDTTAIYGVAGALYKAMYFEIPVTAEDLASGKVFFCIRRTPGLTATGGTWMGSNDHYFLVAACEPTAGVDISTWSLDSADIKETVQLTNAIPYEPGAGDLATYVPAREAYIALDYSASADYGRGFLDAVIPEVKAKLDATDAAIPNIVPADGTYVFTQTIPGYNYPTTAVPFVSDSLWSTVMTVKDGKMSLEIAQRRGSYDYVMAALPSEALAAQTAAGDSGRDASHTPGASYFKNETVVYLDNPQDGSNPVDASITFNGPGEYPMYTGTIEINSLEKPVAISFLGSRWFNRSFLFTQDNMFTADAANCLRLINKLLNSPDPEDVSTTDEPYKVDAALLTDADKATAQAAADAYLALNATDKATIDSRNILTTPAGATDAQTYRQALGVAAEKFGIDLTIPSDEPVTPVAPKVKKNKTYKVSGQSYKVTKVASGKTAGTVTFTKAKNAKTVTIPATVKLADGKKYKVNKIAAKVFKGKKTTKVIIKTKLLKKAGIKNCLKSSKVKTVKVPKAKFKAYKKIFTKKIAGKKVAIKK